MPFDRHARTWVRDDDISDSDEEVSESEDVDNLSQYVVYPTFVTQRRVMRHGVPHIERQYMSTGPDEGETWSERQEEGPCCPNCDGNHDEEDCENRY